MCFPPCQYVVHFCFVLTSIYANDTIGKLLKIPHQICSMFSLLTSRSNLYKNMTTFHGSWAALECTFLIVKTRSSLCHTSMTHFYIMELNGSDFGRVGVVCLREELVLQILQSCSKDAQLSCFYRGLIWHLYWALTGWPFHAKVRPIMCNCKLENTRCYETYNPNAILKPLTSNNPICYSPLRWIWIVLYIPHLQLPLVLSNLQFSMCRMK